MNLSDCLIKNRSFLGPNLETLGKTKGSSCLSGKRLLAYSDKSGWKVLHLNVVQLFLRKYLGFYRSTHLNFIAKRINELPLTDNIKKCHARIETVWAKKNLIGLGNANLSEAEIICFAEKHGDKPFRASMAKTINAHYRPGDVVLVEGLKASQEIPSETHQQTKHLKPGCIVRGWEPENFEEICGSSFKRSSIKIEELKNLAHFLRDDLRMEGNLTDNEMARLKVKLDAIVEKIKVFNRYYKSKSTKVLNADKILEGSFEQLKNGTLSIEGKHGLNLYNRLISILQEFEKMEERALHKNMTPSEFVQLVNSAPQRNVSLVNQINKYRREGRKVFVIAGASHLLEFPAPYKSCKDVKKVLHNNKFQIIIKKHYAINEIVKKFNTDLKRKFKVV